MDIVGISDGGDHAGDEGLVSSRWATYSNQPILPLFLPLHVLLFYAPVFINVADPHQQGLSLRGGLIRNAEHILHEELVFGENLRSDPQGFGIGCLHILAFTTIE